MKTKHNVLTKALSVFLAVLMVAGSLGAGLYVLPVIAADPRSAATPIGNTTENGAEWGALRFIVPEAIYLYPNGSSLTSSTSSPFQYYINNDENNSPISEAQSTGKIYYSYSYEYDRTPYGAETAAISYQFVNGNFAPLSGGSITLSNSTIASGESVEITAGSSPSLVYNSSSCYILWTLTFTDAVDGKVKHTYALTYVYKPYVAPVGAMVRTKNTWGGSSPFYSYAQQITWISGAHSIYQQAAVTHDGNYYPNYSGDKGFSAFITAGDTAYVGNTAYAASSTSRQNDASLGAGATIGKLAFINTPTNTAHFGDAANFGNVGATDWGSTNASASTFNVSSFDYWYKETGSGKHNTFAALFATPYANISIDTSRYSNLSQIPNLAVGLMVTDDQGSDDGNWYIADYSTGNRSHGYDYAVTADNGDLRGTYFDEKTYIIAGQGTNSWNNFGKKYELEGVKYAGAWPRTLMNVPNTADVPDYATTYDYAIKGMFTTRDDGTDPDYCYTYAMVQLRANQYDKSTLRSAVQRAISVMPALGVTGISNGYISSCYFDPNSNYKWTALQTAFRNALVGLTTLDNNSNPNTLAIALNNALDGLCTRVTLDVNGGSFENIKTVDYINIGVRQNVYYSPVASNPAKAYYTFNGWAGSANAPFGASSVTIGYNNTIYAIWKPIQYTITLLPADGDSVNTETKYASYSVETASTMEDLLASEENGLENFPAEREGYSFWYWEVVSADEDSNWTEGEKIYTADEIAKRHGDVTLKAVWAEGMVAVNVYNYEMNLSGSYLNENNRLVPADTYSTYGKTNDIVTITPAPRVGFTVNKQKSRLTGTVAANGSLVLKVYYDRLKLNVSFVNDDGTVLQDAKTYLYGASPTYTGVTPRKASAQGISYTFAGWIDENGSFFTPEGLADYEIVRDTVFTAVYDESEILYNISSSAGVGTVILADEGTYTYGTELTVSAQALDGYNASDLKLYANGVEVDNPYTFTVEEDVEFTTDDLKVVPTYIVQFYAADGESIGTVTVKEGGDASNAVTPPDRTAEGYTFAFWSLPVDNVTDNMTVIAQYYKNGTENYTFKFYNDSLLLATLVRAEGEEFVYPDDILGIPERDSHDFIGWVPSDYSPASENMDVYAQFLANGEVQTYTLTVRYHNGSSTPTEIFTGEPGTVVLLPYPVFKGHIFTGWTGNTAGINGEAYIFQNSNAVIEATWYDLTDMNKAEKEIEAILSESSLYKDTYISDLEQLKASYTELTSTIPASRDALDELYDEMTEALSNAAKYLLYTLHIKVDGVEVETVKDIAGATVTLTPPEKPGYSFNGWKVVSGTVNGNEYTFTNANDTAEATWIISAESIAALGEQIRSLSKQTYHVDYVDSMLDLLKTVEDMYKADPGDIDNIAEKLEEINDLLDKKDENKHTYTVSAGYADAPTCTASGTEKIACDLCGNEYYTLVSVPALGHNWGEWTIIKEATLDDDGIMQRVCLNNCGEKEEKTVSLYDFSDKAVKFVTLNGVSYIAYPSESSEGDVIKSLTLYKWFSDKELRFRVVISNSFAFQAYVVFIDGEKVSPDAEGYYTVPAEQTLTTVTVSGVVIDESNGTKNTFWDWIVNLFRSIADFFRGLFN
ncbi:MAG: InlB B-repeat-containing protein [Oscillospiraceae bacterium]|nr:InlB B-repeat-containing protein [Oscillospiraceae bacterium]